MVQKVIPKEWWIIRSLADVDAAFDELEKMDLPIEYASFCYRRDMEAALTEIAAQNRVILKIEVVKAAPVAIPHFDKMIIMSKDKDFKQAKEN